LSHSKTQPTIAILKVNGLPNIATLWPEKAGNVGVLQANLSYQQLPIVDATTVLQRVRFCHGGKTGEALL
jgi:hypothetical protein